MDRFQHAVIQNFCTNLGVELESCKKNMDSSCYALATCNLEKALKINELLASILADVGAEDNTL